MNDFTKAVLAFICMAFGFIFGEMNGLMITLIVLIVIDYISGVIAAVVEKEVSSEIGAKGIAKKMFMLFIVAIANVIDVNVICEGHVLKSVAILFYIANESISVMENAGRLGVPVPKKLIDVLKQLKDKNNDK